MKHTNGRWVTKAMENPSIESFWIWTVQRVRYMESRKVLHTTVISDTIAVILCLVLASMETVRERCFVQAVSTVPIAGKNFWNRSCNDMKTI